MPKQPWKQGDRRYGDNEFAGFGILLCQVCGDPLRDHPIRPCRELEAETITAPSKRTRRSSELSDQR